MKYAYNAKGVTMPFNTLHQLHDGRKQYFYREVADDAGNLDDRPHLVLFLLMSLENPLREGVLTRIRVATRLATPADGNAFIFANPTIPSLNTRAALGKAAPPQRMSDLFPNLDGKNLTLAIDGLYTHPYTVDVGEFSYRKETTGPSGLPVTGEQRMPFTRDIMIYDPDLYRRGNNIGAVFQDPTFKEYFSSWAATTGHPFTTRFINPPQEVAVESPGVAMVTINSNIPEDKLTALFARVSLDTTGTTTRTTMPPTLYTLVFKSVVSWALLPDVTVLAHYRYVYRRVTPLPVLQVPQDQRTTNDAARHLLDEKMVVVTNLGVVEVITHGVIAYEGTEVMAAPVPANERRPTFMSLPAYNWGANLNYLTAVNGVPTQNTEPVLGIPLPVYINPAYQRLPNGFVAFRLGLEIAPPVLITPATRIDSTYFGDPMFLKWASKQTPKGRTLELQFTDSTVGRVVATVRYNRDLNTFYVETQSLSLQKYIRFSANNLMLRVNGLVEPGSDLAYTNVVSWDDRLISPTGLDFPTPNALSAAMIGAQAAGGLFSGIGGALQDLRNKRHQKDMQQNNFDWASSEAVKQREHSLEFLNTQQEFKTMLTNLQHSHDAAMQQRHHKNQIDFSNHQMQNAMTMRGLGFGQGR